MPHTCVKVVEGVRKALKRVCSSAESGAAPTQMLRKETRASGVVRDELRIWRKVGTLTGQWGQWGKMRTGSGEESVADHVRFRNPEALYISEPAD
jgi:hypothetical protein